MGRFCGAGGWLNPLVWGVREFAGIGSTDCFNNGDPQFRQKSASDSLRVPHFGQFITFSPFKKMNQKRMRGNIAKFKACLAHVSSWLRISLKYSPPQFIVAIFKAGHKRKCSHSGRECATLFLRVKNQVTKMENALKYC